MLRGESRDLPLHKIRVHDFPIVRVIDAIS